MPGAELLINVERRETRAALLEGGVVRELYIERESSRSIVGDVYLGRVGRVMRGMQAAFVDVGLARHAFLQVGDALGPEHDEPLGEAVAKASVRRRLSKKTPIGQVLKPGQEVLVQVSRGPVGTKGARVTSHVSLAGRRLVYLPTVDRVGVSRRIADGDERRRLATLLDGLRGGGGFIVRTAAEGASAEALAAEAGFLARRWAAILERRAASTAPACIHRDLDLPLRIARDLLGTRIERLVVDDAETLARVRAFVEAASPEEAAKLVLYDGDEPLFEARGVEVEVGRALARTIRLPSGGSLVFDHAEALTAIDVNSGRFSGGKDLEDTITQTNLEAVVEVARQLRLRNIGGLIVVDFIDMDRPANRDKVNAALREALRDDRAQTTAVEISALGLVEMTRKGSSQSLARQMLEPCDTCGGTGRVRSALTVACEVVRELRRRALELRSTRLVVECHPRVADVLSGDAAIREALDELSRRFARELEVTPREDFHVERYDIKGGRKRGPAQRTA